MDHVIPDGRRDDLIVVAAIPARFASTRLPGKPLADIGGKTMIQRVYEQVSKARGVHETLVATDDERIAREVERFGGITVMTSPDHPSGTDRLAEVFRNRAADLVINVQGDEPFLDPEVIEQLILPFYNDPQLLFATCKTPIRDVADLLDPSVAKLVVDEQDHALYFSRMPIPFLRDEMRLESGMLHMPDSIPTGLYKHIGLYAYRREFLLQFASWPPAPLELAEKLEQLRALYHGIRVKAVTVKHEGFSIDTPLDLERAQKLCSK